jgi:hypothetical protein
MDFDKVIEFLRAMEQEAVQYVLVGGMALNLLGVTRATLDVDIVLNLDKENVERLRRALRRVWQDPAIEEIRYEDLAGEFPAITYGPPDEAFGIDIVTRFGEMFPYADLQAEMREWQGTRVPVATPQTLYRMKKGTMRLIDKADAAELRERFNIREE